MFFEKISLMNFMSYCSDQIQFEGKGLTLIEGENLDEGGSNGSGKSGLWDGVSYALFGQTVRGLGGDEVINRKVGGKCVVDLQLKYNGSNYTISRQRKPNALHVIKDDKKVKLGTAKMTQDWIDKEFGIDFDLFRCTVMFAQGETFNFIDESNKKQKEILSKIVRVNFDELQRKAKDQYTEQSGSIIDHEEKITVLKSHQHDPEVEYAEELEKWKSDRKFQIDKFTKTLKESEKELKSLKVKDVSGLEAAYEKIGGMIRKLTEKRESFVKKESVLGTNIKNWKREIDRMNNLRSEGKCPTCFSPVSELSFDDEVSELDEKIESANEVQGKLIKAMCACQKQRDEYEAKQDKINTIIQEQKELESEKRVLENRINDLNEAIKDQQNSTNPFTNRIKEEKEKQKKIVKKLAELEKEIEETKTDLEYYQFWVNAFGDAGIKSFIFDLICSSLTEKSNYYVGILTNGQVSIRFDTQTKLKSGEFREKFDVSVITDGQVVNYASYSGGEKRKISLAVDMALSDIMSDYYGSNFNVILFDEQTNYMDRQGRLAFMNLLKEIGKKKKVFVVDHDAEFKAMFDDVKKVRKQDGISKII